MTNKNEEEKTLRFEAPEKPELTDLKEIKPDTEDFNEPERAEAVINCLGLSVGDKIREEEPYSSYDNRTTFVINPRMVLRGDPPSKYKNLIENLKKILTPQEIKQISDYMKRKKKNEKVRDKIYDSITKRTDSLFYRGNIKKALPEDIKASLEEIQKEMHGIYNTIYHLLSKGKEDYLICYKRAWNNKPIPNIQEWMEETDGEYLVLTDSEADQYARDYLTGDEGLWKHAVEAGNTTAGMEDWADMVLNSDGRGSIISGYDGVEHEETINNTDYYIYRTN